jgi:type II secretory pathway component GspD/PulD (secretin)
MKYTEPTEAINILNSMVSSGGTPGRGAATARGKAFSATEIRDTMMLIVTAKFSLLDFIQKILHFIDIPMQEPERMVHIIEVEEAEVTELVSIIENFLTQRTGGISSRRLSRTTSTARTTRTPTPTPRPSTSSRSTRSRAGVGGFDPNEYPTTLIPDPRTQKIIIQTYNVQDLEDINMLVRELDTRFDIRRLKTRIYRMRYLKAVDVGPVVAQVLGIGGGYSGRSGTSGLGSRTTRTGRGTTGSLASTPTRTTGITPTTGTGGMMASLVVPHEDTNSLIIQAEPEEYEEIMNILEKIDVKRRQVFLEAALVQVTTQSALNYTIELLAGEPDDHDTRVLVETSFGLSGIDAETFTRVLPDLTQAPAGMLGAVQHRGKFPALISFFKGNQDSEVIATPFILADDNEQNTIQITETRFVVNTQTVNTATTTSQQGEDAGITLDIFPTINSANNVRLEVSLEVSEFGQAGTAEILPPKTTNSVISAVSIADDRIYVIGGLTRQNKAKTVSKVPIIGDIPLIGKLFRSEANSKSLTNLYVFLRAHILTSDTYQGLGKLSDKARDRLYRQDPDIVLSEFEEAGVQEKDEIEEEDPDAPKTLQIYSPAPPRSSLESQYQGDPESPYRETTEEPRKAPEMPGTPEPEDDEADLPVLSEPKEIIREIDGEREPEAASPAAARILDEMLRESKEPGPAGPADFTPKEREEEPPWRKRGLEIDETRDSWFFPLKNGDTTARAKPPRARASRKGRDAVKTGWIEG